MEQQQSLRYVPTPEESLAELIDSVRAMSRGTAGCQERLIQAVAMAEACLQAPVLRVTLQDGAQLPTRAHDNDAGLDLYCSEHTCLYPGTFVDIPTGVAAEFPPGWWGRIVGRSSTLRRKQLLVAEGTIDEGFRGVLFAGVWNMSDRRRYVEKGERVAQLILCRTPPRNLQITAVDELAPSARGTNGFGSTGA